VQFSIYGLRVNAVITSLILIMTTGSFLRVY
jgi:hypothetical protein